MEYVYDSSHYVGNIKAFTCLTGKGHMVHFNSSGFEIPVIFSGIGSLAVTIVRRDVRLSHRIQLSLLMCSLISYNCLP